MVTPKRFYSVVNTQLVAIHSHIAAILRHVLWIMDGQRYYKSLHSHIVIEREILLRVLKSTHFVDLVIGQAKSHTQKKQDARTHYCGNPKDSLLRCMGKNYHYFCFFIPIVVEVECMDLHHSHYGNRFSIA